MRETIDLWRTRWRERVIDEEREEREPWALPLVVRVEKTAPPTHLGALTAAAGAVVRLLTADAAGPDGPWSPTLGRWADGRIRKVVRRARGARWSEVSALPGVTVTARDQGRPAEVRALLPHPVADPPPTVAKLQVQGLDLRAEAPDEEPDEARAEKQLEASEEPVLTIALNPGISLTTGKACAQVGHAAQLALLELDRDRVLAWAEGGFALRIVPDDETLWRTLVTGIGPGSDRVAPVYDAGFTEVEAGTLTCAATLGGLDAKLG